MLTCVRWETKTKIYVRWDRKIMKLPKLTTGTEILLHITHNLRPGVLFFFAGARKCGSARVDSRAATLSRSREKKTAWSQVTQHIAGIATLVITHMLTNTAICMPSFSLPRQFDLKTYRNRAFWWQLRNFWILSPSHLRQSDSIPVIFLRNISIFKPEGF